MNKIVELNQNEIGIITGGANYNCVCGNGITGTFLTSMSCQTFCCLDQFSDSFTYFRPANNIQRGRCPILSDAEKMSIHTGITVNDAAAAIALSSIM